MQGKGERPVRLRGGRRGRIEDQPSSTRLDRTPPLACCPVTPPLAPDRRKERDRCESRQRTRACTSAVCVFCVSFTTDRRGSERNEIAAKTEKYHRVLPSFIIPFRAHGRVLSFAQVLVRPVAPVMTRYDQRAELARFTRGGSGGSFSRRRRLAILRRSVP